MPSTFRILFSPRAIKDLKAILEFVGKDSPQNAAALVESLRIAAQSLRDFPHRFATVKAGIKARKGTRVMPVPPYLIYYRMTEPSAVVRIITVRHGARRPPRRLG